MPATAAVLLVAAGSTPTEAQQTINQSLGIQLVDSAPWFSEFFGRSVALEDDTALIGAFGDDHAGGNSAGSASVFVTGGVTWVEQETLIASDTQAFNWFGWSVALSGDTAVVGAPGVPDSGAAYVFVRSGTTWVEQQKLLPSDGPMFAMFGEAVAISGDTILIGAPYDKLLGVDPVGSAYVFVRSGTTWTEQQKISATVHFELDQFGTSVALSGDTAVIGAPSQYPTNTSGAAYVFTRNGTIWSLQQTLFASDGENGDLFGYSVSVSGDTALIGAVNDGHLPSVGGTGSAYAFTRSGSVWSEQQKLTASDPDASDGFGFSVALGGDTAVIGAVLNALPSGERVGSAYRFVRNGPMWVEDEVLFALDAAAQDYFGISVAASADRILVGAERDDVENKKEAGSAWVFALPCAAYNYCTPGTSASGCQALMSANGTPSATASSGFTVAATSVEGAVEGIFFWGTSGAQANSWGNGTSFMCVVPPIKRASVLSGSGTNGACDGAFSQDLNALWCPTCPKSHKNPGPGAVLYAQLWYRDPLSTSNQTTSLSDAIVACVGL